jgi:PPOX class probable F420-dependent enzyme
MDMTTISATRILRFLEREPVVWLSTVRPDGTPHLVPIWFTWDGEALLIFTKPDAQKVRNLRANPSVMLALGDVDDDFDVGLIEGRAEFVDLRGSGDMPAAHLEKYADRLAALGLSAADYAATYSLAIRIVPIDFLDWHGRTTSRTVRIAAAPATSLAEPARERRVAEMGEPMSRRRPAPTPRIVSPVRVRVPTPSRLADPFARRLRTVTDGFGQPRPLPVGSL